MKKKRLDIILALTLLLLGFTKGAWSQIYSSENCFYSKAGRSEVEYVVKFESSKVWLKYVSHSTVRKNLSKSENFYENEVWRDGNDGAEMYEYDYQKSTSSRVVYKRERKENRYSRDCMYCKTIGFREPFHRGGCGAHGTEVVGYYYVAFSKDKSSFISWYEKKDDYNGEIQSREDYTRVPKEDLLPKAANYDFLND